MKQFIALSLLTGIVRKPELANYWSTIASCPEIDSSPFFIQTVQQEPENLKPKQLLDAPSLVAAPSTVVDEVMYLALESI